MVTECLSPNSWMIGHAAVKHKVPVDLLSAMIEVESGWNPWAMRYEAHYRHLVEYSHGLVSAATEANQQKTSWGLLQVMGATAREMGCTEPFLSVLCRPEIGIAFGCKYLVHMFKKYKGWTDAVSAYNQGSPRYDADTNQYKNQEYVDKVYNAIKCIKEAKDG